MNMTFRNTLYLSTWKWTLSLYKRKERISNTLLTRYLNFSVPSIKKQIQVFILPLDLTGERSHNVSSINCNIACVNFDSPDRKKGILENAIKTAKVKGKYLPSLYPAEPIYPGELWIIILQIVSLRKRGDINNSGGKHHSLLGKATFSTN